MLSGGFLPRKNIITLQDDKGQSILQVNRLGMQILLRTEGSTSYFRRYLLKLVNLPRSNRLLLCSGYTQESRGYSILNDQLLATIVSNDLEVITVAGKLSHNWPNQYRDFVRRLRASGISLKSYRARRKNWHAKVAIKLRGDVPVAGIIGSSNLTRPAYGEPFADYNYEADVVVWVDKPHISRSFEEDTRALPDPLGPIRVVLNPEVEQPDEVTRLKALYREIMAQEGLEPYEA